MTNEEYSTKEFEAGEGAALGYEEPLWLTNDELLFCIGMLRSRRITEKNNLIPDPPPPDIVLPFLMDHLEDVDLDRLDEDDPKEVMLAVECEVTNVDYKAVVTVLRELAVQIEAAEDPVPWETDPREEVAAIEKMLRDARDNRELKNMMKHDSDGSGPTENQDSDASGGDQCK